MPSHHKTLPCFSTRHNHQREFGTFVATFIFFFVFHCMVHLVIRLLAMLIATACTFLNLFIHVSVKC